MKTERLVIRLTKKRKRTLATLANELKHSAKESRAALRSALAEVKATLAQIRTTGIKT